MQENPDLYKWLTGQLEAPEHMQENPAFRVSSGAAAAATMLALLGQRCGWPAYVAGLSEAFAGCAMPQALRSHVQQQMAENSDSSTHAAAGKDWVRGWDDGSQQQQPAGAAS